MVKGLIGAPMRCRRSFRWRDRQYVVGSKDSAERPEPAAPAGARALGCPVSLGKSHIVGERGPELFTSGASGRIDTSGALRTLTENGTAVAAQSSNKSMSRTHSAQINVRVEGGGDAQDIAAETECAVYRVFARLESDQRGLVSD